MNKIKMSITHQKSVLSSDCEVRCIKCEWKPDFSYLVILAKELKKGIYGQTGAYLEPSQTFMIKFFE